MAKRYCEMDVEEKKEYHRQKSKRHKLDHYIVYYLPEEHYCGITENPHKRMILHRSRGLDTEGWRVLYASEDLADARNHENLFHSILMVGGMALH